MAAAPIAAGEACKVLLGQGSLLRCRHLLIHLLAMEIEAIPR
ncbi:MAG: hypothetical protein WCY68_10945 [Desulfuromonadales bacterium]